MMRRLLSIVALLVAFEEGGAQSPSPKIVRDIVGARDSVWRAWFAHDTALLERVLPSALVAGGGRPIHWNDLATELSDSRAFASSGARLERIRFTNTRVTIDGNVAMVGSDYQLFVRSPQRSDSMSGHAVELFVREGDRWVNPFWLLASASAATGPRSPPK
jgi:hypothetical protein